MAQLIVRNIEERFVRKLKERAGRHGVSMEEEHRRILREALLKPAGPKKSFHDVLQTIPGGGRGESFKRRRDMPRGVDL